MIGGMVNQEEVHRNKIFDVVEFINQRSGDPLDIILSKTIIGFSDFVKEFKPDLVLVHGDRIEALASCIVCSTNYIRAFISKEEKCQVRSTSNLGIVILNSLRSFSKLYQCKRTDTKVG